MSEENKMIYCTQCGSENSAESKFCSNCGSKLEQPTAFKSEEQSAESEGVFSGGGEEAAPVYEKITDAEEQKPDPLPSYQEEIKINYGTEPQSGTQYYSVNNTDEKQGGGNIGFAIASMICGILSLVCCCLTLFSAVLAVGAIVLGVIALCFKYDGKGMAIAGIATGGIGIVFVIIVFIISGTSAYNDILNDIVYDLY